MKRHRTNVSIGQGGVAQADTVADTSVAPASQNATGGDGHATGGDGHATGDDGHSSGNDGNGGEDDGARGSDIILSDTTVVPGQVITVSTKKGSLEADAVVSIELHSQPVVLAKDVKANADGVVNALVTIPADTELGTHHVVISDLDPAALNVVAPDSTNAADSSDGAGSDGKLARTGLEASALVFGALLLVAAGAAGVIAARRRAAQR